MQWTLKSFFADNLLSIIQYSLYKIFSNISKLTNIDFMKSIYSKVKKKLKKTFLPTEHQKTLARWRKDDSSNLKRYDYDLNSNSIVFDLGGYNGDWTQKIYDIYQL